MYVIQSVFEEYLNQTLITHTVKSHESFLKAFTYLNNCRPSFWSKVSGQWTLEDNILNFFNINHKLKKKFTF